MINQMNKLKKNNKYISIYTDIDDTTRFMFGKLLGCDDTYFLVSSFTPTGKNDGIVVKLISDIIKIELDGQYSKKMMELISDDNEVFDISDYDDIVYSVLSDAKNNNRIISIELSESGNEDVIGLPVEISDNICKTLLIDQYGYDDGYALFDVRDITQISAFSEHENSLEKLRNQLRETTVVG